MPTLDDELSQVERDIRTLKIEYEQYFGGGRPRPPSDTQWRVESMMRRFNERTAELNTGQRFRFNNIAQTYAKYSDMWRKKTVQKETGAAQHHYGAAAKAIEAERNRQAAAKAPSTKTSAQTGANPAGKKPEDGPFVVSLSDPERERAKVEELYAKVVEARQTAGEKDRGLSLQDFEKFVRQKSKELKEKGGQDIEYSVNVEGGRVKLKARISR